MSSSINDNSNSINGNIQLEYIIKMPDKWNERCDENKFYKVSEVKQADDLQYQEIRPLTPKRINNADKSGDRNRQNNINSSDNYGNRNQAQFVNESKIRKEEVIIIYIHFYIYS